MHYQCATIHEPERINHGRNCNRRHPDQAEARRTGSQGRTRPAYVLINLPEGVNADDIEIVGITRHAEEALEAIDTGKATKYLRVLVK